MQPFISLEEAVKIEQVMTRKVYTCRAEDGMNVAAGLMWEHDVGCVPVVDETGKAIGMITDRDICMSAYFTGKRLQDTPVAEAMAKVVHAAHAGQTVQSAETMMRTRQVRRLPVVDTDGKLVGIVSLNDLALAAGRVRDVKPEELTATLASICQPRQSARA
jgi:CBS domain-containing protein